MPPTPPWTSIGPTNQFSGRIQCLAIDPQNGNRVVAGSAGGGVWVTTDGGKTWSSLMRDGDRNRVLTIGAIALDPDDPQKLYVASGDDTGLLDPSYPGDGFHVCTINNPPEISTWDDYPMPCKRCTCLLIDPNETNRTVLVGGDSGLYRSVYPFKQWDCICTGHITDAMFDPGDPENLYVGVWNSGLFTMSRKGLNQKLAHPDLPQGRDAGFPKLSSFSGSAGVEPYVVAKTGFEGEQIYKLSAGNNSWFLDGRCQFADQTEYANLLAVHPNLGNIIFAGAEWLDRSEDEGKSFDWIRGMHEDNNAVVFDRTNDNRCYLATDGGVYVSSDKGKTFVPTDGQPGTVQFYGVGVSQSKRGNVHIGGVTQDIEVLSSDSVLDSAGNITWNTLPMNGEEGTVIFDPNDNNTLYILVSGEGNLGLNRTRNRGKTVDQILPNTDPILSGDLSDVVIQPDDSTVILAAAGNQVLKSTNRGGNWYPVLKDASDDIVKVEFFKAEPKRQYALTFDGYVYASDHKDPSKLWNPRRPIPKVKPFHVLGMVPTHDATALAVGNKDNDRIYIGFSIDEVAEDFGPMVFCSADGGKSFPISSGPTDPSTGAYVPINDLVLDPRDDNVIYAATGIGVFKSDNGGVKWTDFNDGLPRIDTTGLAIRQTGSNPDTFEMFSSTMGRGMFQCSLS